MISVVIEAGDDAKALARLLTALVPAAAEGLVRDVLVRGASGLAAEVVEDAGATTLGPGDDVAKIARGDWLCGLPLGARLRRDWMELVAAHLATDPPTPARLTGQAGAFGLGGRLEGWLVPRAASAGAVEQDLQRLARRRGRRLRVLGGR